MHKRIVKAFRNYHLFGFTGTPIFAANAGHGSNLKMLTTPQTFGDQLHSYTIVDAINDGNVLPFRIDYINTMREKEGVSDKDVYDIDREKAMAAPERISEVVRYILEHFDQKTKRNSFYSLKDKRLNGFNSIFAVSSIPVAIKYYKEFKKQLAESGRQLVVSIIYSFAANETIGDNPDGLLDEEGFETEDLDQSSRDALEDAIHDYNEVFHTSFDTSADKFQNYYKDLSQKMKTKQVDILIVVNMFLTGFDATTLNTLWVDKNLKMHGLIQAFSRTNRILNSVKTFGNIVCFRNLQKETDDAIALFGDKDASGIVLLKSYEDYLNGYDDEKGRHHLGYLELLEIIKNEYPLDQQIVGEKAEKRFIKLFSQLLSLRNILMSFDQFVDRSDLSDRDMQDYQSNYLDLYDKYRNKKDKEKEDISDDIVFEMELIKQVEINIDYILMLVEKYHDDNCQDKEIIESIRRIVDSNPQLRSKKQLIEDFIGRVNVEDSVNSTISEEWYQYVLEEEKKDLDALIVAEKMPEYETRKFIENSFRDGNLKTTGTDIDKIMPPMSYFGGGKTERKKSIIEKLKGFFDKYSGLGLYGSGYDDHGE